MTQEIVNLRQIANLDAAALLAATGAACIADLVDAPFTARYRADRRRYLCRVVLASGAAYDPCACASASQCYACRAPFTDSLVLRRVSGRELARF